VLRRAGVDAVDFLYRTQRVYIWCSWKARLVRKCVPQDVVHCASLDGQVAFSKSSTLAVTSLPIQKLLDYCREHRDKVSHVIVADLSRLASNVADQGRLIGCLAANGGLNCCPYDEPHIGGNGAGNRARQITEVI
jgi:hypothetical protein